MSIQIDSAGSHPSINADLALSTISIDNNAITQVYPHEDIKSVETSGEASMNLQKFPWLTQLLACIAVACAISVRYAPAQAQAPKAANAPALTIILTRTPTDTPADATIYVAGSFNNWQTADPAYRLTADWRGLYSIILPASVRGHVEFKFTLGSWDSVELDAKDAETPNRSFEIPATGGASYS
jgi:hypothetical protein